MIYEQVCKIKISKDNQFLILNKHIHTYSIIYKVLVFISKRFGIINMSLLINKVYL